MTRGILNGFALGQAHVASALIRKEKQITRKDCNTFKEKPITTCERRVGKDRVFIDACQPISTQERRESQSLWFEKEVITNWSRISLIIHFTNVSIFAKDKDKQSTSKYVLIRHLLLTMEEFYQWRNPANTTTERSS